MVPWSTPCKKPSLASTLFPPITPRTLRSNRTLSHVNLCALSTFPVLNLPCNQPSRPQPSLPSDLAFLNLPCPQPHLPSLSSTSPALPVLNLTCPPCPRSSQPSTLPVLNLPRPNPPCLPISPFFSLTFPQPNPVLNLTSPLLNRTFAQPHLPSTRP